MGTTILGYHFKEDLVPFKTDLMIVACALPPLTYLAMSPSYILIEQDAYQELQA